MSANVWVVLIVSVLFGLSFGIYEFVLPFFLDARGVSFGSMGLIFSISAAVTFLVRVTTGHLSDRFGRKAFYSTALSLCGLTSLMTPLLPAVWFQALLKSVREASVVTREIMHSLLLYDENRPRFLDFIGRTRGFEYLFQGVGSIVAGVLLASLAVRSENGAYAVSLGLAGILVLAAWGVFAFRYREAGRRSSDPAQPGSLRQVFGLDLPSQLKLLTFAMFVFNVGLSVSHCFIMPLFFAKKFGASTSVVSLIMAAHRGILGVPMIFVGRYVKKHLKAVYITFVIVEGLVLSASALIPAFWLATAVWLTHDLFGAGIWVPINSTFVQQLAREETRGGDVGRSLAVSALGWVVGPIVAGAVAGSNVSMPFFLSGVLVALSALPLLGLRVKEEQGP